MNNTTISRVGINLNALVIGFFGINHFISHTSLAGMVPSFLPGRLVWVYITGIALILAAISFLINKKTRLAGLLLAILLILIVITVHLPAIIHAQDESYMRLPMLNLIKDTGLAAGALMIAGRGN
jgi:uncharacterized membrane protein